MSKIPVYCPTLLLTKLDRIVNCMEYWQDTRYPAVYTLIAMGTEVNDIT